MALLETAVVLRVLLLVDRYLPYPTSQAKLIRDLGVELVRQGHRAAVLSPSDGIRAPLEVTVEDGVEVLRVRGPRIKGVNYALRAINEERLSSLLWRRARSYLSTNRFDIVVHYSPTIFFGKLVGRLKRLWGCKSYLILRDIFPKWAVDAGVMRRGPVWAFFRYRELQQYAAADVVGVELPRNLEYFRTGVPKGRYRLEVLYNWMALGSEKLPASDLRSRLSVRDEVVFLYGGNVGVAQDMGNLVRLAARFPRHPKALFVVVGEGREVDRLKEMVASERLENFRVLPAVPQAEFMAMLREADVGLLSLDRRLKTHNFPGKALAYMYSSLPILASLTREHDLSRILSEASAALCSANGDEDAFLRDAVALASDAELRRKMGANARRLLEQRFSVEVAARQIVTACSAREPTT